MKKTRTITREILEEYSNKEALLRIYNEAEKEVLSEKLFNEVYEHFSSVQEFVVFIDSGKVGVRNIVLDAVVLRPIYDRVEFAGVNNGLDTMFVAWREGKAGIIKGDVKATVVLPFVYDKIDLFDVAPDYARIYIEKKCGIIRIYDDAVQVVLEPCHDDVVLRYPFFLFKNSGKLGLMGKGFMLPPVYDDIFIPSNLGWVKVLLNNEWGYIDVDGRFTTDMEHAYLYHESIW